LSKLTEKEDYPAILTGATGSFDSCQKEENPLRIDTKIDIFIMCYTLQ